ncbi:unknown [Eubacterium sp. CAG:115]|nr:unknown [Eubacterium sp. CAG:115]
MGYDYACVKLLAALQRSGSVFRALLSGLQHRQRRVVEEVVRHIAARYVRLVQLHTALAAVLERAEPERAVHRFDLYRAAVLRELFAYAVGDGVRAGVGAEILARVEQVNAQLLLMGFSVAVVPACVKYEIVVPAALYLLPRRDLPRSGQHRFAVHKVAVFADIVDRRTDAVYHQEVAGKSGHGHIALYSDDVSAADRFRDCFHLAGEPGVLEFLVHLRDKLIAGILSRIYLYGIFRVVGIAQPELDNVILARLYIQPVARVPEISNAKQVAVGIARDLIIEQRRAVSGYVVYLPALALHGELLVLVDADYERKILLPQFVVYLVGDLLDRVGPRGDIDRAFIVRAVLADADDERGVCAVYSDPTLVGKASRVLFVFREVLFEQGYAVELRRIRDLPHLVDELLILEVDRLAVEAAQGVV